MYRILIVFLLFSRMAAGEVRAESFIFKRGKICTKDYYEEIPYEWSKHKMIVTVEAGGKARRFLWDTGATPAVTESLAREMGYVSSGRLLFSDAFGRKDSLTLVETDSLKIGNLIFSAMTAAVLPEDLIFVDCLQLDGIIGSSFLENTIVQFRSDERKIVLTDRIGRLELQKIKPVKMKSDRQNSPVIPVSIGKNVKLELLFDTGDDGFLHLSESNYRFLSRHRPQAFGVLEKGYGSNTFGLHGQAPESGKYILKTEELYIGKTVFTDILADIVGSRNSCIGVRLLEYGRVTLDFIHSRFYFQPYAPSPLVFQPERMWQVMPTLEGEKFVVGVIWGSVPGVKPGDEIVELNGINIKSMDRCRLFMGNFLPEEAESCELKIRTAEGKEIPVVIQKIY